jgi:hypothetical protein
MKKSQVSAYSRHDLFEKESRKMVISKGEKKSKVFAIGCKEPSISLIRSSKLGKKKRKKPWG